MADAYKVRNIPGRVPNEAVFLDLAKAEQHAAQYGGTLVELIEGTVRTRTYIQNGEKWPDETVLSLLRSESDGPFGAEDVESLRRILCLAWELI